MSWRFKASKYKNAAPKIPKPDEWLRELNIGSYQVNGQIIKASASFMAFNADVAGWCQFQLLFDNNIVTISESQPSFRKQSLCHSTQ